METLAIIYLAYMFIAMYSFFFFLLIYLRNKKNLYDYPVSRKEYSISAVIPAYNEQDTVVETIKSILASDYPVTEIIVVNDGSTDNTAKIVREIEKSNNIVKLVNKKNSGKADSLNKGLSIAKSELIAVIDADSFPKKDSIRKMIGFFDDEKVGAVTCSILSKHKIKFIEKLQAIEYAIIAWARKLLDFIGGIWATPGPLAIYRKSALQKVGGFDPNVMVEDIEITWHLTQTGYKTRMCLPAKVSTVVPDKTRKWWRQRLRWNRGGLQVVNKYYKSTFLREGMLGFFIVPFFTLSMCLGLLGISVFIYIVLRRFFLTFFFTRYSMEAGTNLLALQNLPLSPTVLNFFGLILFMLGFIFTFIALGVMRQKKLRSSRNLFNILFYLIFYLTCYPGIFVVSIFKFITGDIKW